MDDDFFLQLCKFGKSNMEILEDCLEIASYSPDPSTQVGAVLVSGDVFIAGYNSFPAGIKHTKERLNNREEKLKVIVHAEMQVILEAVREGVALDGATLYFAARHKEDGKIWGGVPCTNCSKHIIQAGIREIVSFPAKDIPSKWAENCAFARELLKEAGIKIREVSLD